jgi:signal transduction histidine kinase
MAGGEGVGLGLYVVDQIARLHGGTLSVRPAAGGNTFAILLPRKPF